MSLVKTPRRLVITEQDFAAQGAAVFPVRFWIRWLRKHALKTIQIEFSHYFTSFSFVLFSSYDTHVSLVLTLCKSYVKSAAVSMLSDGSLEWNAKPTPAGQISSSGRESHFVEPQSRRE
jgi:hypothetical protein